MKKVLRIVGILVVIAGIGCIFFSNYITTQVNEGKIKIEKGQKKMDQSSGLFSSNPYTKPLGKGITSSGQKKIDEGKQQVAHYEELAGTLKIGGIVGIIVGAGLVIVSFFVGSNKRR